MSTIRRLLMVGGAGLLAVAAWFLLLGTGRSENAITPDPAALERTRANVRMLDDMHKAYVVHITATYVRAQESVPAAHVAKKVYQHMESKGWFSGRLIDATGKPFNEANVAKTAFEKAAVKNIRNGKAYYDEVAVKDGKPYLRAATVVPVVMDQCIKCHTGMKKGQVLGALVYELPIR